jgi:hypothetical protein
VARHVLTADSPPYKKGHVVELTPAQETALVSVIRTVTYRDVTGENVGVSN